jgi:tRNA(Ile2) C34 agmatinyltransferase TiaS
MPTGTFIVCTPSDFPPQERPSCPVCGGDVYSNGGRWVCKECSKQWLKVHNPRVANNPPCVYCGGKVHKQGTNYACLDCGRNKKVHLVTVV